MTLLSAAIGCTRLRLVVVELTLLLFILDVEISSVVSYVQEVGVGRGQKVRGTGLEREEPK